MKTLLLISMSLIAIESTNAAQVNTGTVRGLEVYRDDNCASYARATAAFWNRSFCVVNRDFHRYGYYDTACITVDNKNRLVSIRYLDRGC